MTMSLRKLDINNWLTYDNAFEDEHKERLKMVSGPMRDEVVQMLPGSEEACEELLGMIVEYVTKRYPDMFKIVGDYIVITPLNEKYRVKKPYERPAMDIAGLLTMDDLYLLMKGQDDLYYL